MGTLSFWHIVVVAAVLAVVFAHRQIPAAFGAFGRMLGRLRKKRARPPADNVIEGTFERRDD